MQTPNTKIFIGISLILIVLFILILILPFSNKKTSTQKTTTPSPNQPFPTSVKINPSITNKPIVIKADFTGVAEEQLPKQLIDLAAQKKDLRQKIPLNLSTFSINFDYSMDKFIVTLKDPKDLAQKEFENWRTRNYPGLGMDQFTIR